MQLSQEEQERIVRGEHAEQFLTSEFFQKYLLPYVDAERRAAYPDPMKKGWEDKYRVAWAKDDVYTKLFGDIKLWSDERKRLIKKRKQPETDVNLA